MPCGERSEKPLLLLSWLFSAVTASSAGSAGVGEPVAANRAEPECSAEGGERSSERCVSIGSGRITRRLDGWRWKKQGELRYRSESLP